MYITEKIDGYLKEESKDYQAFLKTKLKKYGVDSLDDMDDETTKKFFAEVDRDYKAKDEG